MNEPTEKLKYLILGYVRDPHFYLADVQEELYDGNLSKYHNLPAKNDLLFTIYWLEWRKFVRRVEGSGGKKKYFLTNEGAQLLDELEAKFG